jgi:threonylcarbamoyladenosine tRNA methylthiotransferase MtaB
MFARTLDLVDACGLTHLHVFPYSPRPGTPAARMPQVAREAIRERARRLRDRGALALDQHLGKQVGRSIRVLAERGGTGRAEDFTPAATPGAEPGTMIDARVAGHDGSRLLLAAT